MSETQTTFSTRVQIQTLQVSQMRSSIPYTLGKKDNEYIKTKSRFTDGKYFWYDVPMIVMSQTREEMGPFHYRVGVNSIISTPTPTPTPEVSTPTPTPTPANLQNINSNSNSRGFNSNSNSNSGKSPEYQLQLQLQLRRFQLQLQFQLRRFQLQFQLQLWS